MWFLSTESVHLYLDSHHAYARLDSRRRNAGRVIDLGDWKWNEGLTESLTWGARPPPARRPLHVYLGSALVKLACVPRPQGLRDDGEREAVLAVALRETLAIDTDEWRLCESAFEDGSQLVGAAMTRRLYGELETVSRANSLRLVSVRPYVFGVIDALKTVMSEKRRIVETGALLIAEADALSVFVASQEGYESASALVMPIEDATIKEESRLVRSGHGLMEESVLRFARLTQPGEASPQLRPFGHEARSDFLDLLCAD